MMSQLTAVKQKIKTEFNQSLFNQTSFRYYFEPIANSYFSDTSLLTIRAQIIAKGEERDDVITLTLIPSKKWKGFIPGQYVQLGLVINGVYTERIFSISSSLQEFKKEGYIKVSIQRQTNGKFTNWIHSQIVVGDKVTISQAAGSFTLQSTHKKILFIAGGAGITPFRSMLYQAKRDQLSATLIYYCSEERSHIFKDELQEIAKGNDNINVHFINTKEGGRCTASQLRSLCSDIEQRQIFICGPGEMIPFVENQLVQSGLSLTQITTEYFKAAKPALENLELKPGMVSIASIQKDIPSDGKSVLLEVLENADLKPRYGCRMGICRQCTCTKKSGYVYNTLTQKWSDNGKETIQACISIPGGNIEIEL